MHYCLILFVQFVVHCIILIPAIRHVSLVVKTLVYQPMDWGSNPNKGNFFFQKNAKISECIYAYLAW